MSKNSPNQNPPNNSHKLIMLSALEFPLMSHRVVLNHLLLGVLPVPQQRHQNYQLTL